MNLEQVNCSCRAFCHRVGPAPRNQGGHPAGNFRCLCPWARTPLSLRSDRKQNLALSAPPQVPGRGTRGPGAWSDLEKVKQASKVMGQPRARGAAARKETLCLKDPFSLSSGEGARRWLHFAFTEPSFGS